MVLSIVMTHKAKVSQKFIRNHAYDAEQASKGNNLLNNYYGKNVR